MFPFFSLCIITLRWASLPFGLLVYESFQVQGNKNLMIWCWSHVQDGRHAHIWWKPFKNLLLRNQQADFHETWYVASGTPAHHSLFKWFWSDLDLFYGKVKFGFLGFSMGKSETVDFSETIAACDLKVGRYQTSLHSIFWTSDQTCIDTLLGGGI